MKFLCDQCKAKYQIADEKVQGKTLRMKCRKCGHVIEIRSGASDAPPASSGDTMQVASLSEEAASAALASPKKPAPQPAAGKPATAPRASSPRPLGSGSTGAAAAKPTAAPRPGASANKPGAPRPTAASKDTSGSALASAFSKSVSGPASKRMEPPAPAPTHDPPAEEWYVAIDEVPVGPIRLTELRSKYAQGAVTDDSLVWREGFEEWRPLRTMAELHGLVREEVSGAAPPPRGSLLPQAPARPSARAPAPAGTPRPGGAPRPAPAATPVAARGNVIPFVQARGAVAARKLDEDLDDDEATRMAAPAVEVASPLLGGAAVSGAGPKLADDPFAAPAAAVSDPFAAPPPSGPAATAQAGATPPPAAQFAPSSVAPVEGERMTMIDRISVRARGVSKGVVALIAAACVLLGVIVAVIAVKPKVVERVVEKRVDVPVSVYVPVGGSAAAPTAPEATTAPEPDPTAPKIAAKSGGGAPAPTAAAPTSTGTANTKLKGLDLGPAGPDLPGTGGGGGGGSPLEGKSVETVVSSKRVGVRKKCYEPWADKGGASVKIRLKIAPSGGVESASIVNSSGEPAVGQCVQSMARGWSFPASGSGGTFDIPFIFST